MHVCVRTRVLAGDTDTWNKKKKRKKELFRWITLHTNSLASGFCSSQSNISRFIRFNIKGSAVKCIVLS